MSITSNHSSPRILGNSSNQARSEHWRRRSVVRRTLPFVQDDIQHILLQSPFLQHSEPGAHVALFHRSEIRTGTRLGKGGFSYVYEVAELQLDPRYSQLLNPQQKELREYYREQVKTGKGKYAIKYLQDKLLSDAKSFQCAASDLAVEAAYMSALDHPNILSVRGLPIQGLDSLSEGFPDSYFIILDRLEDTLDQRITKWKQFQDVPVLEKAGHALELAEALAYLHERGIIFRDLKPNNIGFLDGKLQLLDFGLCRELPYQTRPDQVFEMSGVGTRRYMAVEIVNTSYYNDKADVYSWAMVFWEMLSLEKPYPSYSMDDHKRFVCQAGERPPLCREWPLDLQNLLQHSWTTRIPDRLSMREVEFLLRTYMECCRVLDETPDSPTAVVEDLSMYLDHQHGHHRQRPSLKGLQLPDLLPISAETDEDDHVMYEDHRMSMTFSEDYGDLLSVDGSVFESGGAAFAIGAATTEVSSFGEDDPHDLQEFGCTSMCGPIPGTRGGGVLQRFTSF